jgi:SAM-dependent methyltransferase
MVGARAYDLMYRTYAPWNSDSPRKDLLDLLAGGTVTPERHPRAVDLGCGTGANVIHLSGLGFDALGVDFSKVAIRKALERADGADVPARFVVGDLTAESIPGVDGVFDLLMDFGTLDDLRGSRRAAMARTITRLARPGSLFLELCFYGATEDLPLFSFSGTSKLSHIAPGELDELFGDDWAVDPFAEYPEWRMAAFLLTKK